MTRTGNDDEVEDEDVDEDESDGDVDEIRQVVGGRASCWKCAGKQHRSLSRAFRGRDNSARYSAHAPVIHVLSRLLRPLAHSVRQRRLAPEDGTVPSSRSLGHEPERPDGRLASRRLTVSSRL